MELSNQQKRQLKKQAHALSPFVIVGSRGFNDGSAREIDLALAHHELIKVKLPAMNKTAQIGLCKDIAANSQAHIIQTIGRVLILYRPQNKTTD